MNTLIARAAARLGTTEGRVVTIVIGLIFGLVTAAWGIPPVLDHRDAHHRPPPAVTTPMAPR